MVSGVEQPTNENSAKSPSNWQLTKIATLILWDFVVFMDGNLICIDRIPIQLIALKIVNSPMLIVITPIKILRMYSFVLLIANTAKGTELSAPAHMGMKTTMLIHPPLIKNKVTANRQVNASAKEVIPTEALLFTPLRI